MDMDNARFDRFARLLAARIDRRRGAAAAAAVAVAGTGMPRRATAQFGSIMPGESCAEHRQCALRMDAPATFCLPREAARVCCSIEAGLCASDAECCGAGVCVDGLCSGGPQFDTWIAARTLSLLAAPDAASETVRSIPAGSKVRVISAAPVGGWLTATWEGAYGWIPAAGVVFVARGIV
jgi:hypothetical protein